VPPFKTNLETEREAISISHDQQHEAKKMQAMKSQHEVKAKTEI